MFTTNRVQAAPVLLSRSHLELANPQALVINSGVANAATGPRGEVDALAVAADAARLLGLDIEEVLVLSTGLIGTPLPIGKVRNGLVELVPCLDTESGDNAARAIMTTDTRPKTSSVGGDDFIVGGMAKGSGMIHPMLATMLAVITTDYSLENDEADRCLRIAVEKSFNQISVDGETSTNDAVILMANGSANAKPDARAFQSALDEVCADLARQIVDDGEGMTVVIEVSVTGAATYSDASAVAQRIATSSLVKTAAHGRDPNWGRVLAAAGSARSDAGFAMVDVNATTVAFNGTAVFERGRPTGMSPDMSTPVLTIDIDLGLKSGAAQYLSTDLSYEYVRINAEYTT